MAGVGGLDKGKAPMRNDAGTTSSNVAIEDSPMTWSETLDCILQFIEVAFHTILHLRAIYPAEIFRLHRLYQVPVYRSRHPGLNEYIAGTIGAIREEMVKERVKRVFFVVQSASTGKTLERYVFEVDFILRGIRNADRTLAIKDNLSFRQVQMYFRGFLMKLSTMDSWLEDCHQGQDGLTFAVVLDVGSQLPGPGGEDPHRPDEGLWVPAEPRNGMFDDAGGSSGSSGGQANGELRAQRTQGSSSSMVSADGNTEAIVLPVKSLDSGVINLMLYVEDNPSAKASLRLHNGANSQSKGPSAKDQPAAADDETTTTPSKRRTKKHRSHGRQLPASTSTAHLDLDTTTRPMDIDEALLHDAAGSKPDARRSKKGRKGVARRRGPRAAGGDNGQEEGGGTVAMASDEDQSDSSAAGEDDDDEEGDHASGRSSSSGGSTSSSGGGGAASDASIQSVGDFAGYGGAGAGRGGGGMTAGW